MPSELKSADKLQWLGFYSAANKLSDIQGEINILKDNLEDYSTFIADIQDGIDSYNDFKDYLENNGFSSDQADTFQEKIQQNFNDANDDGSSFDEFKTFVLNETISFESLRTGFSSNNSLSGDRTTEDGQPASGIKFHETEGVSRNGDTVPAGTTEIYGKEIHLTQSEERTTDGGGEEEETGEITYTNITASTLFADIYESVTISATVENTYSESRGVVATFIENGKRIDAKSVQVSSNSSTQVSFSVRKNAIEVNTYQIKTSGSVQVSWTPGTIIL